jgi:hypothetical protein
MRSSAISTTKFKAATLTTNAGINFSGDRLEPGEITRLLGVAPTIAYRKGEIYNQVRDHEIRGRTGLWRLTTRQHVETTELADHLAYLLEILFPGGSRKFVEPLRTVMREFGLEADVDCFWYGEKGAVPPAISEEIRAAFAEIGATIETDFDTD